MDEPGLEYDHKTLDALNEQIAAEETRIADLEQRIRVIDVEVASWKVPPAPKPAGSVASVGPAWFAFFGGFAATAMLGRLIAWVIGR